MVVSEHHFGSLLIIPMFTGNVKQFVLHGTVQIQQIISLLIAYHYFSNSTYLKEKN